MDPLLTSLVAVVLTVPVDGRPVRFGTALPRAAVAVGLRLLGPGTLQWRRLPIGDETCDPVWVEIAIVGATGQARVVAGGGSATPDGAGPAFVREEERGGDEAKSVHTTRWRWCDGTVDERVCTRFLVPTVWAGESFAAGERLTTWTVPPAERAAVVLRLGRRVHERAELLPHGGQLGAGVRPHVVAAASRLRELPGLRGAGDFLRSGGVVTNNEYDTTLALVHLALAVRDEPAFARACRCAAHLVDRDLDSDTGLPFPHGEGHRGGTPQPGHAWAQGLRAVALLTADDDLLAASRALVAALASQPPLGEGRFERARDYAWPLAELEASLAVDPVPPIAAAADALARAIDDRFDAVARTWRFGEGQVGGGVYFERGWLTAGVVVPAMARHLARRPDRERERRLRIVQRALLEHVVRGGPGLPTHWRLSRGESFAEHRERASAGALLVLEAFASADLRRALDSCDVAAIAAEALRPDHPDLATEFTLVARCSWVWR